MTIKDDNKIPDLLKQIKGVAGKTVEVGLFGEIAFIGHVNEYGAHITVTDKMRKYLAAKGFYLTKQTNTISIPERSWLRSSFDDKKVIDKVFSETRKLYDLNNSADGVLNSLGVLMSAEVKNKISSNIGPENHPFTREQKGGKNKTLINRGTMLNSVKHEIA